VQLMRPAKRTPSVRQSPREGHTTVQSECAWR
jgi:hypothetical protein